MSEYVKRGPLGVGYKQVPGGYSDPECTHVILTMEEYKRLHQEKEQAERKVQETKYAAERKISQAEADSRYRIQRAEAEAKAQIEAIQAELEKAQRNADYQRGLNRNLLRMSKERANADRELRPKKQHTGYVVLSSREREYRYKDGNRHWRTVLLWETVLQSPYSVGFSDIQARQQMQEDLFAKDEGDQWMIQRIGINGSYRKGYEEMIEDKRWRDCHQQYNVMLDRHLKANYRTGYWELIFNHTKSLGMVPDDMRGR